MSLDISKYLVQLLSEWSATYPYFEQIYHAIPFGSRIVVDKIDADPKKINIRFLPNMALERGLLTLAQLTSHFQPCSNPLPPALDVKALNHVWQLNNNVSVVNMADTNGKELFILKTNLRHISAIYHELHVLLTLENDPHIISKPLRVVTLNSETSTSPMVIGFILAYLPGSTLRQTLDHRPNTSLTTRLSWCLQTVETMCRILEGPALFYSDLKPDNIMISPDGLHVTVIDFEQGGNWDTFVPPEIFYWRWLDELSRNAAVPKGERDQFEALLEMSTPPTTDAGQTPMTVGGRYYYVWKSLHPDQRQQAMVYSIGKLIWCIMEGVSHTQNAMDEKYEQPTPLCFPSFCATPDQLRPLIRACTLGAPEWSSEEDFNIVRNGAEVTILWAQGLQSQSVSPKHVVMASQRQWARRLEQMKRYMMAKCRWIQGSCNDKDESLLGFTLRPCLSDIIVQLQQFIDYSQV